MQGEEIILETAQKEKELEEFVKDVKFLSRTPPIKGIARAIKNNGIDPVDSSSEEVWLNRLASIFESIIDTKPEYVEISLSINTATRKKQLVVNKIGGQIEIHHTPLELKSLTTSFDEAKIMIRNNVHLSRIEFRSIGDNKIKTIRPIITATMPLFDDDGIIFAVLKVNLDLTSTFEIMKMSEFDGIHMHFITDENGRFIYRANQDISSNSEPKLIQDYYPEFREVINAKTSSISGQIVTLHNGKKMVMAYKKLMNSSFEKGQYLLMIDAKPYSIVVTGLDNIRTKSAIIVMLLIVVGGMLAIFVARKQIQPLETLKEAILKFSTGEESISLPTDRSDEIGLLAKEFKVMTQKVMLRNKEIQQSEERFRQFAEHINDVFWVTSADGGQVVYASPAFESIWGISREKLYQDPNLWREVIHFEDINSVIGPGLKMCGLEENEEEFRIIRPDNKIVWINNRAYTVKDEKGEIVRILGVAKDITSKKEFEHQLNSQNKELKEANAKLQEAQNQLLQSEKMASVGQLAAGVAHEINNPAGYVNSNICTLKEYTQNIFKLLSKYEDNVPCLSSEKIEEIDNIKREIEYEYLKTDVNDLISESLEGLSRLKNIVQDLKDFSRVDQAEWQWADIHQGIDSTLNIVHNELKYKADVIKDYGNLPEVECIASQINQVVMNMLVNAAHAIDERGSITIQTGMNGNDWIWVKIADTGKGISKENIRKIFDPFFTTKPVGEGTGLGMSLSYSIIERHAGNIEVESEIGKGTTFTINIPVKQQEMRAEA